jgi:hypothetical protein
MNFLIGFVIGAVVTIVWIMWGDELSILFRKHFMSKINSDLEESRRLRESGLFAPKTLTVSSAPNEPIYYVDKEFQSGLNGKPIGSNSLLGVTGKPINTHRHNDYKDWLRSHGSAVVLTQQYDCVTVNSLKDKADNEQADALDRYHASFLEAEPMPLNDALKYIKKITDKDKNG